MAFSAGAAAAGNSRAKITFHSLTHLLVFFFRAAAGGDNTCRTFTNWDIRLHDEYVLAMDEGAGQP